MTKIILKEFEDRKHVINTEDLMKNNWAGSGLTLGMLIAADPVKTGYSKQMLHKISKELPPGELRSSLEIAVNRAKDESETGI